MSYPFQFRLIPVLLTFVAATALWACSTEKDREQEESENYNAVNCDETVDSFNARCDELQLSDDAFREIVCVTYEDPGCLAWCMDFRQDCEAVLDCYDLRDCDVPAEDAGDDETDEKRGLGRLSPSPPRSALAKRGRKSVPVPAFHP